ncbi:MULTISPECIES: FdtA/QdtA family cupin domain-containing protein [unclassified Siphonobacter]|uniref:sugar 3,4-ketoisomerase n=1 Tax=unclassified Siphonobacter TaxID=2635712 RepID=UPI00278A47BE|nr:MULTISPECIES: FdtA/QdtA family cupin domain-containing protein [unclassified Siphonobacter]MDQ1089861.1 dTDP-4-dehydrorhamnose 3,5-epimerase-like enzyme [Siphonobacter sp. SORGH_AS_1065]MDR6197623.1 dTDP-4-dehydrorhamnose 3,5-epimerase-like enzyme [Siphonobacter sp. SORGH_AS_0500]
MAHLINLKTFTDSRGNLTVIEKVIPFPIKRIFYIYGVDDSTRGGHRHHTTIQAAICIRGTCTIYNDNNLRQEQFILNSADKCLILNPEDWHQMYNFSEDAILMVLASEYFDADDYIYEPYERGGLTESMKLGFLASEIATL